MCPTATIATIGATQCSEFITHKMLIARPSMAAAAENAYLVNKITFLQSPNFTIGANIP